MEKTTVDKLKYTTLAVGVGGLYFRRCPDRVPESDDGILSPCDGEVIKIEGQTLHSHLTLFDVHCQRAPVSGTVVRTSEADMDILSDIGIVNVHLYQGQVFKDFRLVIDVKPGDILARGDKVSHIWFGSRVTITIPDGYHYAAQVGDVIHGGKEIIARRG